MQTWAHKLPSQQGTGTAALLFLWLTVGFRASLPQCKAIALTIPLQSWQPACVRNKAILPFLLQMNILCKHSKDVFYFCRPACCMGMNRPLYPHRVMGEKHAPNGDWDTVRTGELRRERKSCQGVKAATGMTMGAVPPPVLTKPS